MIYMENDKKVDPRGLRDGEFSDSAPLRPPERQRQQSFLDQRRQECIEAGYTEDQIQRELIALVRVLGD